MDECYELHSCLVLSFLILEGEMFAVLWWVFVVSLLLYKHGGYPVFCYEMDFFLLFAFTFWALLVDSFGM